MKFDIRQGVKDVGMFALVIMFVFGCVVSAAAYIMLFDFVGEWLVNHGVSSMIVVPVLLFLFIALPVFVKGAMGTSLFNDREDQGEC